MVVEALVRQEALAMAVAQALPVEVEVEMVPHLRLQVLLFFMQAAVEGLLIFSLLVLVALVVVELVD